MPKYVHHFDKINNDCDEDSISDCAKVCHAEVIWYFFIQRVDVEEKI